MRFTAAAIATLFLIGQGSVLAGEKVPSWLVGTWTVTFDEDGTPPDFSDFTADGRYINHGFDCSVRTEMPIHFYNGDIYVTGEIPDKGPIALVFRPSPDKKHLTYTSPRTRNNATLERLPGPKCPAETPQL
jgi:hypothetical protein